MELLKSFINEEDGIGTIEIVLILAVLVGLVILFKSSITSFFTSIWTAITGKQKDIIN
jgi:Flp pilus assembly pilin Flp